MMFRVLILISLVWTAMLPAQVAGVRKRPGIVKENAARRQQLRQIERLSRMSVKEREEALERLPPGRRQEARRRLEAFQKLSPGERERLGRGLERFRDLPPERQAKIRRLFRQFNEQSPERKTVLRQELDKLRQLEDDERRARINSDEFRNKYSLAEQQLLSDLSEALPGDDEED